MPASLIAALLAIADDEAAAFQPDGHVTRALPNRFPLTCAYFLVEKYS